MNAEDTLPWRLETTGTFDKDFRKLDRIIQKRVLAYLLDLLELPNPRVAHRSDVY